MRAQRSLSDDLGVLGQRKAAGSSAAAARSASPPPIVRTPAALELQHQQQGYVVLKNELTKGHCRALRSAAERESYAPSHSSGPIFNGSAKGKRYHTRDDSWAPGAGRDLEKARFGSF